MEGSVLVAANLTKLPWVVRVFVLQCRVRKAAWVKQGDQRDSNLHMGLWLDCRLSLLLLKEYFTLNACLWIKFLTPFKCSASPFLFPCCHRAYLQGAFIQHETVFADSFFARANTDYSHGSFFSQGLSSFDQLPLPDASWSMSIHNESLQGTSMSKFLHLQRLHFWGISGLCFHKSESLVPTLMTI